MEAITATQTISNTVFIGGYGAGAQGSMHLLIAICLFGFSLVVILLLVDMFVWRGRYGSS